MDGKRVHEPRWLMGNVVFNENGSDTMFLMIFTDVIFI